MPMFDPAIFDPAIFDTGYTYGVPVAVEPLPIPSRRKVDYELIRDSLLVAKEVL